ncbi:MAG: hypothetical protein JWR67_3364 [Mucilaginibacter sp.]|nr:hypothetical protein [Mucilaginibacter sp.]MDB5112250.1 hypothetical protein [Mucilaginibacter sp.]
MNKFTLLTLIAVIALGFTASAQIQQGNVMIGGNFTNLNLGLNKPNVFSLDITPKAAWFIQDNVALGGYVNFGLQTAKGSSTTTTYGVGALGRYYTGSDVTVLRHGRIFAEATAGFGGTNVSKGGGHTNGFNWSIGPGFAYFVTPNIGLETLLKYNGLTGFGNQSYQSSLNLFFGLQIYLPGRATATKVKGDVR